ncbi:hypothetical protein GCM10027596_11650 [Nocardioides korecus]
MKGQETMMNREEALEFFEEDENPADVRAAFETARDRASAEAFQLTASTVTYSRVTFRPSSALAIDELASI